MDNWNIEDIKGNQLLFTDEILDVYEQSDFKPYEIHESKKVKSGDLINCDDCERNSDIIRKLPSIPLKFKPHLILDIDETLVSSIRNLEDIYIKDSNLCTVHTVYLSVNNVKVLIPNCIVEFITLLAQRFQIWIYSMGDTEYVNRILNIIDPKSLIPENRRYSRRTIQELKKDILKMSKDFSKGNFVILDDNINSWKDLSSLRPFIVNCKYFDYSNQVGNVDRVGHYYFDDVEVYPNLYLDAKNSYYYRVSKDELQFHFVTIRNLMYKISDIYIKRVLECGGLYNSCALGCILNDLRSDVLNGIDLYIMSYNLSVMNCSVHLAKQLGATVHEIPSAGCVIFIDRNDAIVLKDAHENINEFKFYDLKFIFDCYFYIRRIDMSMYLYNKMEG